MLFSLFYLCEVSEQTGFGKRTKISNFFFLIDMLIKYPLSVHLFCPLSLLQVNKNRGDEILYFLSSLLSSLFSVFFSSFALRLSKQGLNCYFLGFDSANIIRLNNSRNHFFSNVPRTDITELIIAPRLATR